VYFIQFSRNPSSELLVVVVGMMIEVETVYNASGQCSRVYMKAKGGVIALDLEVCFEREVMVEIHINPNAWRDYISDGLVVRGEAVGEAICVVDLAASNEDIPIRVEASEALLDLKAAEDVPLTV
jgi:hypothetical protein